eukprot:929981-Prymnesium_polylepis.1
MCRLDGRRLNFDMFGWRGNIESQPFGDVLSCDTVEVDAGGSGGVAWWMAAVVGVHLEAGVCATAPARYKCSRRGRSQLVCRAMVAEVERVLGQSCQ